MTTEPCLAKPGEESLFRSLSIKEMYYERGKKSLSIFACLAFVGTAFSNASHAAVTYATSAQVYLQGDPNSWVGGAIGAPSATWTQTQIPTFSARTIGFWLNAVEVFYDNHGVWSFVFGPPTGTLLHNGMYLNALGSTINSPDSPWLTVDGNARGDNLSDGWFYILNIAFDGSGNLARLAVDFKQYDDATTMSGPGIFGSLRYNDPAIPLNTTGVAPVPAPAGAWLFGSGLLGLASAVRRRR